VQTSQHFPKLSACPSDSLNFQTGHFDEHPVDHNQQTSKERIPAQDEIKQQQSNEAVSQFRRCKRDHISKKEFEFDPRRKT
jgi:hypothetical protein